MAKKKKANKNNNKPDWVAIKRDYITKNISYPELADLYKVPLSTLNKRASKEEWVEARKEYGKIVERKYLNRMSNEQAREYVHIEGALKKILKSIEDSLEPMRNELYKYRVYVEDQGSSTIQLDQINTQHIEELLAQIDKAEGMLSRLYGILPKDKQKEYEVAIKQAEAAVSDGTNDNGVQVIIGTEAGGYSG